MQCFQVFHYVLRVAVNPLQPRSPKVFWTDATASCTNRQCSYLCIDMLFTRN